MRNFNIQITKKNPEGEVVNVDFNSLNIKDRIKFEMAAIELFDQLVEKDDCREAKNLLKQIQYL